MDVNFFLKYSNSLLFLFLFLRAYRHGMKRLARILPCALLLVACPALQAERLVDWSGNYVSALQQYSNPNSSDGKSVTRYGGFSGGNPLLLSPSAGYSGTSARFYGEVARTAGSGTFTNVNGNSPQAIVLNNSSTDQLQFRLDGSTMSALFLWKQEDFLNGFNTGSLDLVEGSTIALNMVTNVGTTNGRAVVRVNNSYYISSTVVSSGATGLISADLTTLSWFNYDPASSLNTVGSSFSLVSGGLISNVKEVGFYFSLTGIQNAIRLDSVKFDAIVVPESSTYALLAGGLGLSFLHRRKRAASKPS